MISHYDGWQKNGPARSGTYSKATSALGNREVSSPQLIRATEPHRVGYGVTPRPGSLLLKIEQTQTTSH